MIYDKIKQKYLAGEKIFSVLIDPDKYSDEKILQCIELMNKTKPDFILLGGSINFNSTEKIIEEIKKSCEIPIILFPGNFSQFSEKADALFFLSLISGRNPEYLIGQQVNAAPIIFQSKIETISVGYILIESGSTTSVEYVSNTKPIPANKKELAIATALAGEMLGHKTIYLEAGSGAKNHVPIEIIKAVKKHISIPLIVGGGIRNTQTLNEILKAGADMIVVGNIFEKNMVLMTEFAETIKKFK